MEPLGAVLAFCIPMADGGPPPGAVVKAFIAAYNDHDLAGIAKVVTADAEMGAPGNLYSGSQVVERYRTLTFVQDPNVNIRIGKQLISGDLVAQTEIIRWQGQTVKGMSVYRVKGGCITAMSISND